MQAPRVPTPAEIARSNELKTTFMARFQDAILQSNIPRFQAIFAEFRGNENLTNEDKTAVLVFVIRLLLIMNIPGMLTDIERAFRNCCSDQRLHAYEDREGYTPEMRAIEAGNFEIFRLLYNPFNRSKRTHDGRTTLDIAKTSKNQEILKFLERAYEHNDELDLMYSVLSGNIDKVRGHLSRGVRVNCIMSHDNGKLSGCTPLFLACMVGNLEMVRLLLENRANPMITAYANLSYPPSPLLELYGRRHISPLQVSEPHPEIHRLITERIRQLEELRTRPAGGNRKSARKTRRRHRR